MITRFKALPKYAYIYINHIRLVAKASITAEAEIVIMKVSFRNAFLEINSTQFSHEIT